MRGRTPRCRWALAGCAALLSVAAFAVALWWNSIFEDVMASQVKLTPTSRSYHEWLEPSLPLYFDVYLFNWTNPDAFPEEIPHVDEIGPYRFREYRRHTNVTWHTHNASIGYRTHRAWEFLPDQSKGSMEDEITMLNVIAASAAYRTRNWELFRQTSVSLSLTVFGHGISITKFAQELLFEGYEDSLLDIAKSLPASVTGGAPPVDKFGLFYGRNNTYDTDGYMEVSTGVESGTLPGQILRWNYDDHLPYYEGECSKLRGSAGEFFQRNMTEESRLTMFIPDLCRTVHMEYLNSGELKGLEYRKYEVQETSFDASQENTCFCNGECDWHGVMNVSACRYGAPAFISLPHFLHGDPKARTLVTGIAPDPEKHSFYMALEPRLGVPVDVAARFQFNVHIEPNSHIRLYENVPKMLFPIFWVEQRVQVDEGIINELRYVRAILDWGTTFCACAALFFAVLAILVTCCKKPSKYAIQEDMTIEKPKDEAEIKLNSI